MENKFLPIKNFAELKRTLKEGAIFMAINHRQGNMIGLKREVNIVQTTGLYTKVVDQPDHEWSTCNGGRGAYMQYGKAKDYLFDTNDNTIHWIISGTTIMEFGVISAG